MGKRTIFTKEADCLHKVCRPVDKFDKKLAMLIDDMAETMYEADGVGLAGPQVGILRRIFVIDVGDGLVELVNPEILETSGLQQGYEGCLSVPGEQGYVERPNHVKVRGSDRNGVMHEYEGEGLFARAVLHENDHLDGNLYLRLVTEPPEDFKRAQEAEQDDDTEDEE